MIGEFILNIIFGIVTSILNSFSIGDITWNVAAEQLSPFMSIVATVCYFLPLDTISTIVGIIVAFAIFRAVIRLIVTIWDLLPIA